MAAAMAARRFAHAGRRRDGQAGGRRRRRWWGAQPRRGPIPGGEGASSGPKGRLQRGNPSSPRGPREQPPPPPPPPGVTSEVPRRPSRPGGTPEGREERAGLGAEPRPSEFGLELGVGSGRHSVASRGCPSTAHRRPLARRCHRRGRGGYRRVFQAPA